MSIPRDERTTLYQLAGLSGAGRAEQLRRAICEEALLDESWRALYDQRLASGGDDPENGVLPGSHHAAGPEIDRIVRKTRSTLRRVRTDAPEGLPAPADTSAATTTGSRSGGVASAVGAGRVPAWLWGAILGVGAAAAWLAVPGRFGAALTAAFDGAQHTAVSMVLLRGALLGAALCGLPLWTLGKLPVPWRRHLIAGFAGAVCTFSHGPLVMLFAAAGAATVALTAVQLLDVWKGRHGGAGPGADIDRSGESLTELGGGKDGTLYGTSAHAAQAVAVLRAHASRLGAAVGPLDETDAAAAMIGADAWMFALGGRWFDQAASFGPASVGALAAVLARAAGEPVAALPDLGGRDADEVMFPGVEHFIARWVRVAARHGDAAVILTRAGDDLCWGGGGEDRLSLLGRRLRQAARDL